MQISRVELQVSGTTGGLRALLAYRPAQDNVSTGAAGDYNVVSCTKDQCAV